MLLQIETKCQDVVIIEKDFMGTLQGNVLGASMRPLENL